MPRYVNFPPPTGLLDEHETVGVEVFNDVVVVSELVAADRLAWLAAKVARRMNCIPTKALVFIVAISSSKVTRLLVWPVLWLGNRDVKCCF